MHEVCLRWRYAHVCISIFHFYVYIGTHQKAHPKYRTVIIRKKKCISFNYITYRFLICTRLISATLEASTISIGSKRIERSWTTRSIKYNTHTIGYTHTHKHNIEVNIFHRYWLYSYRTRLTKSTSGKKNKYNIYTFFKIFPFICLCTYIFTM